LGTTVRGALTSGGEKKRMGKNQCHTFGGDRIVITRVESTFSEKDLPIGGCVCQTEKKEKRKPEQAQGQAVNANKVSGDEMH